MTYIFNTQANSYFAGQDLRIEDTETHNVILMNVKDGMWAVEVKDDATLRDYPANVRAAIEVLGDRTNERLYQEGIEDFWRNADDLAQERGFERVYTAGRSNGWMAVAGTEDWEPQTIFEWETDPHIKSFLSLAFATVEAIEGARSYYCERVMETMQELQIELSKYADWVGADIRSLDGDMAQVTKLEVIDGQVALRTDGRWFAFADEAKLVRKANGEVPARLTADPIMEQVFQIIEARGNLSKEEIDAWLDADDDNDPTALYPEHIAPGVNAIEDEMLAHFGKDPA